MEGNPTPSESLPPEPKEGSHFLQRNRAMQTLEMFSGIGFMFLSPFALEGNTLTVVLGGLLMTDGAARLVSSDGKGLLSLVTK